MKKTFLLIFGSALLLAGCSTAQPKTSTENNTDTTKSETTTASQTYTLAEVAKHGTQSDCWLVVDGSVYDVTKFIPQHPGGKEILKGCGKDASFLFHGQPNHGDQAENMMKTLKIGTMSE